jgi:hypothetical protein
MIIANKTQQGVYYTVSSPGSVDCGSLDSNGSTDVGYDNTANVKVQVSPLNVQGGILSINVDETGPSSRATIRFIFE